jgi:membrane-associated protease RseP (regulator of RpoE activity)
VSGLGIAGAIVVLLASIMMHEAGHFLTAKHYGMKATRFFLGFGPTLWSFRRGETEYGVKAVPAGGFVKIIGMTPLEEVEPGDEGRAFYRFPAGQRTVVLSAGSFVHLVIALLMTFFVLVFVGDLSSSNADVYVRSVSPCVTLAADQKCLPTDPKGPAQGVLQTGDRLLSVDGQKIDGTQRLRDALHADRPSTLTIVRAGRTLTVSVRPVGLPQKTATGTTTVARIGVLLDPRLHPPSVGVGAAVPKTFSTMGEFFSESVQGLGRIPATIGDVLAGRQRGVKDVGSVIGATRVSGEIAGASGIPVSIRIGEFFLLMAGLNFFIGVFNMLPLLPLDGGHVAILAFESARSRVYRAFGRHDPGRVDLNKVMPFTYAVFIAIVAMSVILLYADIFRPIKLNG